MANTTLPALLDTGDHASRPAASAVGTGALYSCTDHSLVYQTDGSSWTTWASLGGGGIQETLIDAAGDLILGSAADTAARLAIGTNGYVLTSNGTTAAWAAAAGGGDLVYLSETVLGSAASTISVSSIAGTYRDLVVVLRLRGTDAGAGIGCTLRVGNGSVDTGANYAYYQQFAGWTSGNNNGLTGTSATLCSMPNSGATAGSFGSASLDLMNYADTAKWRGWVGQGVSVDGSGILQTVFSGQWKNAASAIDIVQVVASAGNFDTGSAMTVYGRG